MKMKKILQDIWRNFKWAIIIGTLMFLVINLYLNEMDLIWYFVSITLATGGTVACIIYGIKEYFKK